MFVIITFVTLSFVSGTDEVDKAKTGMEMYVGVSKSQEFHRSMGVCKPFTGSGVFSTLSYLPYTTLPYEVHVVIA